WFYVNGRLVHQGYHEEPIEFKIPAGIWKQGANKILVKFSPNRKPEAWGVGLYGNQADYFVRVGESRISLMNGDWQARPSWETPRTYKGWMNNEGSLLYNAMISPLIPLAIRGALWYLGESNAGRAFDYRASFP